MSYLVSARKYRPRRFDEVVGQEQVSQTLKNALKQGRVAQSFLFCGPHGVGKTTCARILAKALNCENVGDDREPCNSCSSCEAFDANASFNILELDAASNNGVEHIRQLNEQVRLAPQSGKRKIFIIDEVHMLSQSAFNAFLKTLEEPPPYAVFILATTEKHKVLPTILSRCQIFDFNRIQNESIVKFLTEIAGRESVKCTEEALYVIAKKANGAMRDALSLFDKVVSSTGQEFSKQDVIDNLSLLDDEYYFKILDLMLLEDLPSIIMAYDEVSRKGFQAEIFLAGLAEHVRNVLMSRDLKTIELIAGSTSAKDKYLNQALNCKPSFLLTALDLLNECEIHLSRAYNKNLHVEICLSKICYAHKKIEGSLFIAAEGSEKKKLLDKSSPTPSPSPSTTVTSDTQDSTLLEINEPKIKLEPKKIEPEQAPKTKLAEKEETKDTLSDHPKVYNPNAGIPSLASTSLEELQKKIKLELDNKKEDRPFKIEEIKQYWVDYINEKVEIPSAKHSFEKAQLKFQGYTLSVSVGSNMQRNDIQDAKDLLPFLWEKCENPKLIIKVEIDPALKEEVELTVALSPKEKFQAMSEKNPALIRFARDLDLNVD